MIKNNHGILFNSSDDPFEADLIRNMVENAYAVRTDLLSTAFHSRKDINKECDYPDTANIRVRDYQNMYDRNPIAQRVVDILPDDCWQLFPSVYESEDPEKKTAFDVALSDLGKSLVDEEFLDDHGWYETSEEYGNPLWTFLHSADRLAGIGHYGIVLFGLDDGKELSEPVAGFEDERDPQNKISFLTNAKHRLLYLSVFAESSIQTVEFENNRYSPRYRRPKYYSIDLGQENETDYVTQGREMRSVKVHWSRVLHIADEGGGSRIIAEPRQRPVWNNLLDLLKIYGGDAEAFWKNAGMRIFLETHPQLGGDVTLDSTSLKDTMWNMENGLQKWAALTGMSAKTVSPSIVDPSSHIEVQLDAICIKIPVPKRKFLGSERGELASGQDDGDWNDRVRGRRTKHLIPRVVVPFINRLIRYGVLPTPKAFKIDWQDPDNQTPAEQASLAGVRVEAMAKYIAGGVDALIDPMDFLTREMGLEQEEAKEILERAMEWAEEKAEEQAKQQAEIQPPDQAAKSGPNQPQTDKAEAKPGQNPNAADDGSEAEKQGPTQNKTYEDEHGTATIVANEVSSSRLNKPFRTPDGPKKFAVYVKNDKGNTVLVRFGDPGMEIKRDDPERRKSFRARHNCSNPGPKWKPRYWSCKMWQTGKTVASVTNEQHSYASTQINLPQVRHQIDKLQSTIDPNDVVELEKQPHVTVRYGLHEEVPIESVQLIVKQHGPLYLRIGELSLFRGELFDVLKYQVHSDDLVALNSHLGILKNTQTHPDYSPHLTVAYLKKGTGEKYCSSDPNLIGKEFLVQEVVYSSVSRNHTGITTNIFCPTGPGGGVDATCSPKDVKTMKSGDMLIRATKDEDGWKLPDGSLAPEHIQNTRIRPDLKDVFVSMDPDASLLAVGSDAKNRLQYVYSENHAAKQAAAKFGRINELRKKRQEILGEVKQDAKNPELKEKAECLQLVMHTGMRPGSDKDTKADYESFGATTLQGRHVRINKDSATLTFVAGKSKGKPVTFKVTDPDTVAMLKRRKEAAGSKGSLFNTSAPELSKYSQSKDGGGFKTKDHRTAIATEVAVQEIAKIGTDRKFRTKKAHKEAVKKVAVRVSSTIGNTPAVALKSYIDPSVFLGWKQPEK